MREFFVNEALSRPAGDTFPSLGGSCRFVLTVGTSYSPEKWQLLFIQITYSESCCRRNTPKTVVATFAFDCIVTAIRSCNSAVWLYCSIKSEGSVPCIITKDEQNSLISSNGSHERTIRGHFAEKIIRRHPTELATNAPLLLLNACESYVCSLSSWYIVKRASILFSHSWIGG